MKIGNAECCGRIGIGVYVGSNSNLRGKTSLLQAVVSKKDKIAAQFDDMSTGHGLGWFEFPKEDFEIERH